MATTTAVAPVATSPAAPGPAGRKGRWYEGATAHVVLVALLLVALYPIAYMFGTSFKSPQEILNNVNVIPRDSTPQNYADGWTGIPGVTFGTFFLNSLVVVSGSLTLTMLFGATAAYVFARYDFRFKQVFYYLFVGGMMFPVFLALVPLFFVVKNAGLFGTWRGLILVYAAYSLPFTVFFLTAFFRTLPQAVAEAALIDGCGHFRLFFRVMLPMARPGLISVAIFNFLSQWNQFILPEVLMQGDDSRKVLAQGLSALAVSQGYKGDFSGLFAGLTIAMLPVLAVYVVFQRQIQSGLTAGQLK